MRAMKADIELVLTHDGDKWVARNGALKATGLTLGDLDDSVRELLRSDGRLKGSRVAVFMGFDFDTLPAWMRQYASHYFNRTLVVDL